MGELIKEIIETREVAMKVGKASIDELLGVLMESNHKQIQQKGTGMCIEEVIGKCKLLYILQHPYSYGECFRYACFEIGKNVREKRFSKFVGRNQYFMI